jgi:hypothetical protein
MRRDERVERSYGRAGSFEGRPDPCSDHRRMYASLLYLGLSPRKEVRNSPQRLCGTRVLFFSFVSMLPSAFCVVVFSDVFTPPVASRYIPYIATIARIAVSITGNLRLAPSNSSPDPFALVGILPSRGEQQ